MRCVPGRNGCGRGVANPCGNLFAVSISQRGQLYVHDMLTVMLNLLVMFYRLKSLLVSRCTGRSV